MKQKCCDKKTYIYLFLPNIFLTTLKMTAGVQYQKTQNLDSVQWFEILKLGRNFPFNIQGGSLEQTCF